MLVTEVALHQLSVYEICRNALHAIKVYVHALPCQRLLDFHCIISAHNVTPQVFIALLWAIGAHAC